MGEQTAKNGPIAADILIVENLDGGSAIWAHLYLRYLDSGFGVGSGGDCPQDTVCATNYGGRCKMVLDENLGHDRLQSLTL
jgi:hypothetical protein